MTHRVDGSPKRRGCGCRSLHYRAWLIVAVVVGLSGVTIRPSQGAVQQEVVFRVGNNSNVDWFEINNPSIHGTLNVTNAPYGSTTQLNAAAVDVARNRLIYDTPNTTPQPQGYAINLAGLQLIPNGVVPVTVTALGTWPDGGADAGYRKADGEVYYHVQGSDQLRRLNFGPTGLITGFTAVGNLNGGNLPNSITTGDIDFSNNGSIWLAGDNDNGNPTIWNFDFTTLNTLNTLNVANIYRGTTFNAEGDTLYGYESATGKYGIISLATGAFQSVLATDPTLFGTTGDLATGTANITILPEPASLSVFALSGVAFLMRRRRS